MARFAAAVEVAAPPEQVWQAVTHWPSHARWVPLTTVRVLTPAGTGLGARFVARTGIGPVGFDDPMEVVQWRPPTGSASGLCRLHKLGRVVLGDAELEVTPRAGGSLVQLREQIELAPARLTRPFAALVSLAGRLGAARVLRTIAAEVEGRGHAAG